MARIYKRKLDWEVDEEGDLSIFSVDPSGHFGPVAPPAFSRVGRSEESADLREFRSQLLRLLVSDSGVRSAVREICFGYFLRT